MAIEEIKQESQSLQPSAIVELFVIDLTGLGGDVFRFTNRVNEKTENTVWQGNEYIPLPIEAEGFSVTTAGKQPRPKIRLANIYLPAISSNISSLLAQYDDLIKAPITRKRTFAKYLDAVNFVSGNPTANPAHHYPDELWFVDSKSTEDRNVIEWELASAWDLEGVMIPGRPIQKSVCPFVYRGPDCGYTGTDYFTSEDVVTANPSLDVCSKSLDGCSKRFGVNAVLPIGSFPGAIGF